MNTPFRFRYVVFIVILFLFSFNEGHAQSTLTLSGFPAGNQRKTSVLSDFQTKFPNTEVVFNKAENDNEITTALLSQDNTTDIYYISSQYGMLQNIRDKGLFLDLSDMNMVKTKVSGFYPCIQNVFLNKNSICAYPMEMYFGQMFYWNAEIAHEMGLDENDIPNTFFDLMNLVKWWKEEQNSDMSDYGIFGSGDYTNPYAMTTLELYKEVSLRDTGMIKYDTMSFRKAMKTVAQFTTTFQHYQTDEANNIMSDNIPNNLAIYTSINTNTSDMLNGGALKPIALSFDEGTKPIISISFTCFFINPYSQHIEEAKAMLDSIINYQSNIALMAMTPSMQKPHENPNYQTVLSEIEGKIADYKKRLETCKIEDRKTLQDLLDHEIASKAYHEAYNRFDVSSANLSIYQDDIVPYFFISGNTIYEGQTIDQTINEIYNQYAEGLLGDEDFVKKLDRTVTMIALENK